jgi:hypothetical protein
MLLSHQVPEGQVNAGSFYWRFDHAGAGFTEDTVFGLLGLKAASAEAKMASSPALEGAIAAATTALSGGIGGSGKVYEHLSGDGASSYSYAAEVLAALCQ